MNRIDLHMHSIYSNDGDYQPEELVAMCKEAGIRIMAVADHNSCKACEAAVKAADASQMVCIPAIELDCRYVDTDLHVLGYGIDYRDPRYAQAEEQLARQERESSEPRIRMFRDAGLKVDEERAYQLAHNGYVTGEVIAEVTLTDPANDGHPMLEPYRAGGKRSDNPYVNFYWDQCGPGKSYHIPIEFMSLSHAIELIVTSGGIPVLAHPGNNVKEDDTLLEEIIGCGIRGIEVYSSYHTEAQIRYYAEKAERYGLYKTCGSDFHGKTKPSIHLGEMQCDAEEEIRLGLQRLGFI